MVDPSDDMRNAPLELVLFVFFYGRCAEALEFYKNALGGSYEIAVRDGNTVHYATFTGPGISLALNPFDAARATEICNALADGGTVLTPLGDAQWGGKFGALHDRFGTEWFVTAP
ncbi:MAG: hypothetical protein WB757_00560 [Candidatus Cybelea sp.]